MGILYCLLYFALLGLLCFPLGRLLARMPLNGERPPFAPFAFERGGTFYRGLRIESWKRAVPDVSRIFPSIVPKKEFSGKPDAGSVETLIRESCVAELVHFILCLLGVGVFRILPGWAWLAVYLVYVLLGNLPFILIQRYNRPRLVRLYRKLSQKERINGKYPDSQLQ